MAAARTAKPGTAGAQGVRLSATERARRRVVRLVLIVYWLLIFEGVLRKWVAPNLEHVIYFIRDPFVIAIYLYALGAHLFRSSGFFAALMGFAVIATLTSFVALLSAGTDPRVLLIGIRTYFLYVPLPFVMWHCFRTDDLARFVRGNLWLAMPIAVLAVMQYVSPPGAYVNQSLSGQDSIVLVADMVRPYGTFTYASGHTTYVSALLSLLAVAWVQRRELGVSRRLLVAGGAAILVMSLTTGSRSIYFFMALVVLSLLLAGVSNPRGRVRTHSLYLPLAFATTAVALFASLLAPAYEALRERQAMATAAEGSVLGRAFRTMYDFVGMLPEAAALGQGLGAGTTAGAALAIGVRDFMLAENEWQRNVLELGPLLGLTFIALRIALVLWLAGKALRANRQLGNPVPLILLSFAGVVVLNGPITGNTMTAAFAWLFVGLILAASTAANQTAEPARQARRRRPLARVGGGPAPQRS